MTIWSCATCGIEHPDTDRPPASCAICEDERQYLPPGGQRWTTQAELAAEGHRTTVTELEPDLYGISVEPRVGIGQRCLLLRTEAGNLLWEPPGLIDQPGVELVRELGGVAVVSASHPHLTGASIQWSHAFGGVPVFVASADRQWIRRPDEVIRLWAGTEEVLPGVTFVQCGGHFAGSSVTAWARPEEPAGVLLTGDTIMIGTDRSSAFVMRSYVNGIPLPERAVRGILDAIASYPYDRLYTGWASLDSGAADIVSRSLERYIRWLRGDVPEEPAA
jgi:glyoxylase-like metal-dependent hydrolase (beta-lactamase superfamily II)